MQYAFSRIKARLGASDQLAGATLENILTDLQGAGLIERENQGASRLSELGRMALDKISGISRPLLASFQAALKEIMKTAPEKTEEIQGLLDTLAPQVEN